MARVEARRLKEEKERSYRRLTGYFRKEEIRETLTKSSEIEN